MTARPVQVLHGAALRVQLPLLLACVPVVASLAGLWIAGAALDAVLDEVPPASRDSVRAAVRLAVLTTVVATTVATVAAAAVLREVIRAAVTGLVVATRAIAAGDFAHRIELRRRDEIGALADAIDVMAARLERLEQSRRHVLACVSHELRTPATIIQGHAYTLTRRLDGSAPDITERLELVQAESQRLARLVGDLVDASSLHAGGARLDVERVDLCRLLRCEVERHLVVAREHGVHVDLRAPDHPLPADIDPTRLGQVLSNLLANAIRHAAVGSDVTLTLAVDPRTGVRRVTCANACVPMGDDELARLFEPFAQGGDHERTGSVGLGLAIVRALVEAHGGTVGIDEQLARAGVARFVVELPAPIASDHVDLDATNLPRELAAAVRAAATGVEAHA